MSPRSTLLRRASLPWDLCVPRASGRAAPALVDPRDLASNTLTLLSGVGITGNPATAQADQSPGGVHDFGNGTVGVCPTVDAGDLIFNGTDQYHLIQAGDLNSLLGAAGYVVWTVRTQLSLAEGIGAANADGYLVDPVAGKFGIHVAPNGAASEVYAFQLGAGGELYPTPRIPIAHDVPFLTEARWDGADIFCRIGETEESFAAPSLSAAAGFPCIGLSIGSRYTHMRAIATVVCNAHLDDATRAGVRAWLIDRYGL